MVQNNSSRWDQIKHLADKFEIKRIHGYAHFSYFAKTSDPEAMKLSAHDVAIIADGGNLCFGGRSFRSDDKGGYSGIVHTD